MSVIILIILAISILSPIESLLVCFDLLSLVVLVLSLLLLIVIITGVIISTSSLLLVFLPF